MPATFRKDPARTGTPRTLLLVIVAIIVLTTMVVSSRPTHAIDSHSSRASATPSAGSTVFLPLLITGTAATPPPPAPTPIVELPFDPRQTQAGRATYYNATGAGNCMFDASPQNLMVGAMNQRDYADSMTCGAYVEISGPRGVITVRIVDRCPECEPGDIDLSREAFALIADPIQGIVPITWRLISPTDLSGPISYRFKEGSNPWWTAVQIRNHRNLIARFEYLTDAGEFKAVERQEYNYFVEASGMGPGPYTFRVTDIYGNTLTDSGVVFVEGGEVAGDRQFPPQP